MTEPDDHNPIPPDYACEEFKAMVRTAIMGLGSQVPACTSCGDSCPDSDGFCALCGGLMR